MFFLGSSTLPRNLTYLDQVQCSKSSVLNLSSIQSNLTLLSSNAANIYTRGGRTRFGAKENRGQRMKDKIPYQNEEKYKPYEQKEEGYKSYNRGYSRNPDYGSYRKKYEPESVSFEMRGRSRQRSTSREARSVQGRLSRSRSRSPGRTDSRSRSRSGSCSRFQSAGKKGCLRCGLKSHVGKFCTVFAFCETKCKICDLYHRTQCCNKKKGQNVEANVVDIMQPKASDVSTNIINVDWAADEKSGSEVLSSLTSLPEWENMK